eukprot:CAMPEP_0177645182 /NCGR_PEP_ID=MMETSP0447-20121125/9112_1 /TAXON_ID=0 /ORGANISM="Stygamoeba regulata, Strain BSH-02190019" /LENGTH=216 /DNA_ID=CAMNT_0019147647 /DNA_START=182 /DNA_END=832 /DNA_ORIENTATION=+
MADRGGIVYTALWENDSVLTHLHVKENMDLSELARNLFAKIDCGYDHRKSFSPYQGHTFHYIVEDEVCFLAATVDGFPLRIVFAYLDRAKEEFFNKYAGTSKWKQYKLFLAEEMEFYSNNPDADKIRNLQNKVDDVTSVMRENIEVVLERGDRLEDLEAKSAQLQDNALIFHKSAKKLKCKLCKQNARMTIICIIVAIVVIGVIAGIIALAVVLSS